MPERQCPECGHKMHEEWSYYYNAARLRCDVCCSSFFLTPDHDDDTLAS